MDGWLFGNCRESFETVLINLNCLRRLQMSSYRSETRFQLTATGSKTRETWRDLPGRQKQRKVAGMTSITFSVCTCRVERGQGSTAAPVKLKLAIIHTHTNQKNMFLTICYSFILSFSFILIYTVILNL